eukprot:scaffold93674_cov80-Cyclotella_meneghiniana.AAC.1
MPSWREKKEFEWDCWASVGCKAGPSTPYSPLTVGSRYAAIPDRQRSAAGWLPSERHRLW